MKDTPFASVTGSSLLPFYEKRSSCLVPRCYWYHIRGESTWPLHVKCSSSENWRWVKYTIEIGENGRVKIFWKSPRITLSLRETFGRKMGLLPHGFYSPLRYDITYKICWTVAVSFITPFLAMDPVHRIDEMFQHVFQRGRSPRGCNEWDPYNSFYLGQICSCPH